MGIGIVSMETLGFKVQQQGEFKQTLYRICKHRLRFRVPYRANSISRILREASRIRQQLFRLEMCLSIMTFWELPILPDAESSFSRNCLFLLPALIFFLFARNRSSDSGTDLVSRIRTRELMAVPSFFHRRNCRKASGFVYICFAARMRRSKVLILEVNDLWTYLMTSSYAIQPERISLDGQVSFSTNESSDLQSKGSNLKKEGSGSRLLHNPDIFLSKGVEVFSAALQTNARSFVPREEQLRRLRSGTWYVWQIQALDVTGKLIAESELRTFQIREQTQTQP